MIEEVTMYSVICDNCGEIYQDYQNDFTAWPDENCAMEALAGTDWVNDKEKTYCPDCAYWDSDTDQVLFYENKKEVNNASK